MRSSIKYECIDSNREELIKCDPASCATKCKDPRLKRDPESPDASAQASFAVFKYFELRHRTAQPPSPLQVCAPYAQLYADAVRLRQVCAFVIYMNAWCVMDQCKMCYICATVAVKLRLICFLLYDFAFTCSLSTPILLYSFLDTTR